MKIDIPLHVYLLHGRHLGKNIYLGIVKEKDGSITKNTEISMV